MLKIIKKNNNTEVFDTKKINNTLSWANNSEKQSKWYDIKGKWNNFRKSKNKLNPFSIKSDKDNLDLASLIVSIMNTTPEEDERAMKRTLQMINYMIHPYDETQIEEYIYKYTHNNNAEDFYYKVHNIKMTQDEYYHYLDKKALNEKLSSHLSTKSKTKQIKI